MVVVVVVVAVAVVVVAIVVVSSNGSCSGRSGSSSSTCTEVLAFWMDSLVLPAMRSTDWKHSFSPATFFMVNTWGGPVLALVLGVGGLEVLEGLVLDPFFLEAEGGGA